ncbi:hypothetical protein [Humibacter sp.]|uniref:hypothetical protein n=1 Tax=Humibacter sp. TaxID=1940291 RepID=UPI003F7DE45E
MTRPFDYVAWADRVNEEAHTRSIFPPAYPSQTALRLYEAHEREIAASKAALCSAPRCPWCGVLTNGEPHCRERLP